MSNISSASENPAIVDTDNHNENNGLRRKLHKSERRKCPHCRDMNKWLDNLKELISHCKDKHHLKEKNSCRYCKAPFGDLSSSKKDRDVHEAKDHPPTSTDMVKQKQKKHSQSVGKAKSKAKK